MYNSVSACWISGNKKEIIEIHKTENFKAHIECLLKIGAITSTQHLVYGTYGFLQSLLVVTKFAFAHFLLHRGAKFTLESTFIRLQINY